MKFALPFLLIFAACGSKTYKTSPTKEGAIATVMEGFYGNYDPATKKSTLKEGSKIIDRYQKMRGAGMFVLPGDEITCEMKKYMETTPTSGFVITACNNSIGGDCDTCAPVMGIAKVSKNPKGEWEVNHGTEFFKAIGKNGKLPDPVFVKLGKDAWALQFDSYGESDGKIQLDRSLMSTGPEYKELFYVPVSGNNKGHCGVKLDIPCYEFNGVMQTEASADGFGDIRMDYKGTAPTTNPKIIRDETLVKKFCYLKGQYVRPCVQ